MQNAKATQNIHLANRLENIFHSFSLFLLTIFPLVFVDIFPTPLFSQRRLREIGGWKIYGIGSRAISSMRMMMIEG